MEISVIVPIIKEKYINELIKRIHKTLNGIKHEIIVVELVPEGEEPTKIKDAIYVRQKSRGLGRAVLEGLEYANGKYVVVMDGDGSHRPEDIPKMLKAMRKYDIVIGSRFVEGGVTNDYTHRKFISFLYRNFANIVLGLGIKDSMSGFSCTKKEIYEKIKLDPIGFKINMELVYKAKKMGYKIGEVPIIFEKRKCGVTTTRTFNRGEIFKIIRFIFELKLGIR